MSNHISWLFNMEFVSRLVQLRKKTGLSQQGLANAININVSQIKRYEKGSAQPTLETLVKLAKTLNVTLDDLVFDDTPTTIDEHLKLQFESISKFDNSEKIIAQELIESLILKHHAKKIVK